MTLIESLLVIFAIIALGFFCERRRIFNPTQVEGFEVFLLKIAMPCYLFTAALHYDFSTLFHLQYVYSYCLAFLTVATIATLFFRHYTASTICMRILASGYVNVAIYTIPVITFLLGDPKAGVLANFLQVIIIQALLITTLSLINHKEKSIIRRLLTIFSTPLIIMSIVGLLCNALELYPHLILTTMVKNIGNGASSIALFTFGLTLGGIKISRANINRDLLLMVGLKNILHPMVAFLIGRYVFSLDGYWLYALVIAAAAPPAFVVYLIAKQFSVDKDFVRIMLAMSSIVSLFSLIFIIFILRIYS